VLSIVSRNSGAANTAMRKLAVSLADSSDLRVILSVFYTIVEVLRCNQDEDEEEFKHIQEEFRAEICIILKCKIFGRNIIIIVSYQISIAQPINDELLAVKLLSMVTKFCSGSCPHFPMKKVLLLLWKVLLVSLGGSKELRDLKGIYNYDYCSKLRIYLNI